MNWSGVRDAPSGWIRISGMERRDISYDEGKHDFGMEEELGRRATTLKSIGGYGPVSRPRVHDPVQGQAPGKGSMASKLTAG